MSDGANFEPVLRDLEPADEDAVLRLFDACADWFQAATGAPSGPADVQSLFYALPEGADLAAKQLLVMEVDDRVVGIVDVVLGWPNEHSATCGLFLVHPEARRRGIGRTVAQHLLDDAARRSLTSVSTTVPTTETAGRALLRTLNFVEETLPPRRSAGNRTAWAGESNLLVARRTC